MIQRHLERFGAHHGRVDAGMVDRVQGLSAAFLVGEDDEVEPIAGGEVAAEGDDVAEFPVRIDVE